MTGPRVSLVKNLPVDIPPLPERSAIEAANDTVAADEFADKRDAYIEGLAELATDDVVGSDVASKRAMGVVWAAMLVGPFPSKIASLARERLGYVRRCAATMLDAGVWTNDGTINFEWDENNERVGFVSLVMHCLACLGKVVIDRPHWSNGKCWDCQGPRSYSAGKRCSKCYHARAALLRS